MGTHMSRFVNIKYVAIITYHTKNKIPNTSVLTCVCSWRVCVDMESRM